MTGVSVSSHRFADDLTMRVTESGDGRPMLVLHGGGGPTSVAPIVAHLAERWQVLAPTIPGFDGMARPSWFSAMDDVALACLDLLRDGDLEDVIVVGSSVGGWIAAEMAVRDAEVGRVGAIALLDAVGVEVPGQTIRDFFALDAHGVAEYSFHDSEKFYVDPASMSDDERAGLAQNLQTLRVYAGNPYMHDPKLLRRLARISVPTLVLWGDSDRIATPAYGAAFAQAIPGARFEVISEAGHLPHLEQPERTFGILDSFLDAVPAATAR